MLITRSVEVLFTPAEFQTLAGRNLNETVCVVFDVLRATSSMVTALANGAKAILPVAEIDDALEVGREDLEVLLAGERDGVRIEANLTGSTKFDLGNSPREFTREKVDGKKIAMTTTNGTRALRACAHGKTVLVGSFLNLKATTEFLEKQPPSQLLVICSGTFEQAAFEDVLAAGALCYWLFRDVSKQDFSDSVSMAMQLFLEVRDLNLAMSQSRNGRRLMSRPELKDDITYCAQQNKFDLVAGMGKDGWIRKL
jgi:2-phosphosulfolactate phosphatase